VGLLIAYTVRRLCSEILPKVLLCGHCSTESYGVNRQKHQILIDAIHDANNGSERDGIHLMKVLLLSC
jgi:hypothetical protein